MRTSSPLRYPGGKTCILNLMKRIIDSNFLTSPDYAEPFSGGSGLGLALLFSGYVNKIHINDIDRGIWSFWYSILKTPEDFIKLIEKTPVTITEWYKQKEIASNKFKNNPLDLGFAVFFLNRTNRSGIIDKAGPIGGYTQNGKYKIDCRFNKENLIRRIYKISKHRDNIQLHNLDAKDFLEKSSLFQTNTFFMIDPPYFKRGRELYSNFYNSEDHSNIAKIIFELSYPWVITYDNEVEIRHIYKNYDQYEIDLRYSVQTKRLAKELLITSNQVILIDENFRLKKV